MSEFEKLVLKMRGSQKKYFKTRDRNVLVESKQLEREVDEHLKNINQPKMF